MTKNLTLESDVPRFKSPKPRKKRYNFSLDADIYERLADAAYHTRRSMSAFVEFAVLEAIKSEEDRNGSIPPRPDGAEES